MFQQYIKAYLWSYKYYTIKLIYCSSFNTNNFTDYRQKTEVYGGWKMNEASVQKWHSLFDLADWKPWIIHDKESAVWSSELVVGIKVKTEAKMHEDKHDCNHFYWNSWIGMSVCLSIWELTIFKHICLNLALSTSVTTESCLSVHHQTWCSIFELTPFFHQNLLCR